MINCLFVYSLKSRVSTGLLFCVKMYYIENLEDVYENFRIVNV